MGTPDLKQFQDLTPRDFERHPVWIQCHIADYDEPWYDETDEETFRPWTDVPPVDPEEHMLHMFLVRGTLVFSDGSAHPGFLTPAVTPGDLGTMQPQVFIGEHRFGFWGGMIGIRPEERRAFYEATGRTPRLIFPLRFAALTGLARGVCEGQVEGFYRQADGGVEVDQ